MDFFEGGVVHKHAYVRHAVQRRTRELVVHCAKGETEDARNRSWKQLGMGSGVAFGEREREREEEVSERSERAFWKTRILAMKCAKWLQT